MKKILLSIFALGIFLFLPKVSFATGYSYYRAITTTSTTSIASGTNANFPMLVSSTLTAWESSSTGGGARIQKLVAAPNGGLEPADLIFTTSTPSASGGAWNCGTSLNFETESYSSSTGALVDWVNVPSLSAGSVIYACYGNASVSTDQSHPSSTWDSNYALVAHLPNGTTLNGGDSTSNANTTSTLTDTATTGQIDGGATTNGSQYIAYANSTSLNPSGKAATMEMWVYPTATGQQSLLTHSGGNKDYGMFLENSTSQLDLFMTDDFETINLSSPWVLNAWNFIVGIADGTHWTFYLNGSQVGQISDTHITAASGGTVEWGSLGGGFILNNGSKIDELRLSFFNSGSSRSASWILTEYNNQSSPSTFYSVGAEQTVPSSGGGEGATLVSMWNVIMRGITLW